MCQALNLILTKLVNTDFSVVKKWIDARNIVSALRGIDKEKEYYDIAVRRLVDAKANHGDQRN